MKYKLTQDQFSQLTNYENHLFTATNANYIRSVEMRDAQKLANIFHQVTKRTTNFTCGRCMLEVCKVLGELYFNFKPIETKQIDAQPTKKQVTKNEKSKTRKRDTKPRARVQKQEIPVL